MYLDYRLVKYIEYCKFDQMLFVSWYRHTMLRRGSLRNRHHMQSPWAAKGRWVQPNMALLRLEHTRKKTGSNTGWVNETFWSMMHGWDFSGDSWTLWFRQLSESKEKWKMVFELHFVAAALVLSSSLLKRKKFLSVFVSFSLSFSFFPPFFLYFSPSPPVVDWA